MNFFAWLILGLIAYSSGFGIRHFWYKQTTPPHDKLWQYTGMCFAAWVVVFAGINFWVLGKPSLDIAFVLVSSAVATGIFYYGISTDTKDNLNLPD